MSAWCRAAVRSGLVVLTACGGVVVGEAPEDAGLTRSLDASTTRDGSAPETAADGNQEDAQAGLCPSAQCPEVELCLQQFVPSNWPGSGNLPASPPGVYIGCNGPEAEDDIRRLGFVSDGGPQLTQLNEAWVTGGLVFDGTEGRYAFARLCPGTCSFGPGVYSFTPSAFVIASGHLAPEAYDLVVQYLRCGGPGGECGPQDAASED